ncbi:MAG TPA: purine-nucleoside phosphorylase [Planctomycetota bacterium]|nr:purine-nucleoside phosphorylase [Planctomycetota bacterium]
MASPYDVLAKAADAVAARLGRAPVGVVLGSGLSEALDGLDHPQFMDYAEVPGLAVTSTAGHPGSLLYGHCGDTAVLALCGRVHVYEGRPVAEVIAPVRLLSLLGVHTLLVTSTVGSADPELLPGHVMLVEDHVNLSGVNVLAGPEDRRMGPRFFDMSAAYDPKVLAILEDTAQRAGLVASRGMVVHFQGPSYETPAEVRLARLLGARAVSMSMVPEVLAARQRGMRVGGLASVTNMAAGLATQPLTHEDVLVSSADNASCLQTLIMGALPRLATYPGEAR